MPSDADRHARIVLGLDAGGTSTRCVVCTLDGEVIGRGTGPGASTQSSANPAEALRTAMTAALEGLDPSRVEAAAAGMAGAGAGRRSFALEALATAAEAVGLAAPPVLVTDLETSYAAGTTEPTGLLVISGTGAVSAWISDGIVTQRADGWGWLVGDAGSAVWQGRRAVEAVLHALDGRGRPTLLQAAVREAFALESAADALEEAQLIVRAVYGGAPAELGKLAPAVGALADTDAVAAEIVREATAALLGTAGAVLSAAGERPPAVVIGGSVLTKGGPVAEAVVAGLSELTGQTPKPVRDPELGAAVLAIRAVRG